MRQFDLRDLEHSTIIYESPNNEPLLRVEWNKKNVVYLAAIQQNSNDVMILDLRSPMKVVRILKSHQAQVNSIAWAPHSSSHIVTAGDDHQTLIWSLSDHQSMQNDEPIRLDFDDPNLSYKADGPVHSLLWCQTRSKWISIAYQNKL